MDIHHFKWHADAELVMGFLKNRHITVVEWFLVPLDPGSYVVGRILLLVGSPKANIPMNIRTRTQCSKPCHWGPAPKLGLGLGPSWWVPGDWAHAPGAWSGPSLKWRNGSAFRCGLTTHRRNRSGLVYCGLGSVLRQAHLQPDPWLWKLAFGTCNVTSLAGKELQLVERVER